MSLGRLVGCVAATVLVGVGAWLVFGWGSGAPRLSAAQELAALDRGGRTAVVGAAGVSPDGVGWAMNGIGLWLTSDGGAHWRPTSPILPGGDVIARAGQVEFVDPKHGWISGVDLIGNVFRDGSDRYSAIDRTTDGGRTWKASAADCAGCGGSLSFLDAKDGFALTGWPRHNLARTDDGGVTWHVVARAQFVGSIDFLDTMHGWGTTWSAKLYRTQDGGKGWTRVRFARSGLQETEDMPQFFGALVGVVSVRFRRAGSRAQRAVIYVTRDGGSTWSARPAAQGVKLGGVQWGTSGTLQFSAATPRVWYLWAGGTLWTTSDAGTRWTRVSVRVPMSSITNMTFTSPTTGWAIFYLVHDEVPTLARTTDGGRDWLPLTPPVPKLPPPPPPIRPCASPCRRP